MKTIFELLAAILWGFGWHFFGRITCDMHPGWKELSNYVAGVECTLPVLVFALRKMGFSGNAIFLAICAYELSFLLIGIGTALGWLTFPHSQKS